MREPVTASSTTAPVRDTPESVRDRTSALAGIVGVVCLYIVSAAFFGRMSREQVLPFYSPDEFLYGHLARSVADGDGLTWRGQTVPLRSALYVYLIAPFWKAASTVDAYAASRLAGSLAISAVVFPTWLVARRYMTSGIALAATGLSVLGVWMTVSVGLLTEVVAFPLAVASLASLVFALGSTRRLPVLSAIGFAALATLTRSQLGVLFPIMLAACVVEGLRLRRPARSLVRRHGLLLTVSGLLTLVGTAGILFDASSVLGIYESVGTTTPGLGALLSGVKDQALAFVILTGVLPATILLATSARVAVWRSDPLARLLEVTWLTILALVVLSGYFLATHTEVTWSIERYVMYAVPLAMVAALALAEAGFVRARDVAVAGTALSLLVLTVPGVRQVLEERALYAVGLRGHDLLSASAPVSLAVFGLLTTAIGTLAVRLGRGRSRRAGAALVAVALAVPVIVQAQAGWSWQVSAVHTGSKLYPSDLQWLDKTSPGPVARMVTTSNSPRFQVTEFFNRKITQVFVPDRPVGLAPLSGKTCTWTSDANGGVTFGAECGAAPTRVLLDDDFGKLTFNTERYVTSRPGVGRVVDIGVPPPSRPSLRAILYVPCSPPYPTAETGGLGRTGVSRLCFSNRLTGEFHLARSEPLRLKWRGGSADAQLSINGRVYPIPKHRVTSFTLRVPPGNNPFQLELPWSKPPPVSPLLIGATLGTGLGTTELLY